jgi:alpha-1,2-mannosyltransferase
MLPWIVPQDTEAYYRLNEMALPSGSWLTSKRLCAHGMILAVCLWSLYVWVMATPSLRDRNGNFKGTDFLHFYTLGSLALARQGADLYDMNAQAALVARRVPEAAGIRYLPLYPPQVSLLFAPLARLPYAWALTVWWVCCACLYGVCCCSVWRACPNLRNDGGPVAVLAIAFPAFFHLIAWGQTSALALACFTLLFFLLRSQREFLAGLVLGCLILKPQLGLAPAILFLALSSWKLLAGAILSAAAQLSVGVLYYGVDPLRHWFDELLNVRHVLVLLEPRPYQTHSLRTFWTLLVPWDGFSLALYVLSAVAVLALTIALWKRDQSVPLASRYSCLLLATVLVAPHLTVYDLVILAPAFLLLADWLVGEPANSGGRWLGSLLYLAYILPLAGPFTRWTHLQLSVVAMSGCVYVIWRMSRRTVLANVADCRAES